MTQRFDIAVVGAGPAGSAAAWKARQAGANVVLCDKAIFPRNKPCGDGLTARAVSFLQQMGLAQQVKQFHHVNYVNVYSPRHWQLSFPRRPGMPNYGCTVSRRKLDNLLLHHAENAGVEVRQHTEICSVLTNDRGWVNGLVTKTGERIFADAVIAADGAYSPLKRILHPHSLYHGYSAIAIRVETPSDRPDTDSLDIYLNLHFHHDQLPGYSWVFPMGDQHLNIGLGYVNSYRHWRDINATLLLTQFLAQLPSSWNLPSIEQLKASRSLQAWRLPMGFTIWPPWRPGILFAGDALGAGKPASGAGISKALESGLYAGECAVGALVNGGPANFMNYSYKIQHTWGKEYRRGRLFHYLLGYPRLAHLGVKLIDQPLPRDRLLRMFYRRHEGPAHRY